MSTGSKVQKPSHNFQKQELILTNIKITSKPVKTTELDYNFSSNNHKASSRQVASSKKCHSILHIDQNKYHILIFAANQDAVEILYE